jgi:hypothetical protein
VLYSIVELTILKTQGHTKNTLYYGTTMFILLVLY